METGPICCESHFKVQYDPSEHHLGVIARVPKTNNSLKAPLAHIFSLSS